jgi:cysteine/O-acetylserine efflux protein
MDVTSFLIYCTIAALYTFGATIGFALLLVFSVLLNTILMTILPKIILVMQMLGSGYMLYLAYQICRLDASKTALNQTATFLSGFLMQFFIYIEE